MSSLQNIHDSTFINTVRFGGRSRRRKLYFVLCTCTGYLLEKVPRHQSKLLLKASLCFSSTGFPWKERLIQVNKLETVNTLFVRANVAYCRENKITGYHSHLYISPYNLLMGIAPLNSLNLAIHFMWNSFGPSLQKINK